MKFATQQFIEVDDYDQSSSNLEQSHDSSHLSEQIFEMCQMFSQQRPDLEEFAQGFKITKVIEQMGEQQLVDSVDNMIRKENSAAVELRHATGLNKADDFLKVIHDDRIRKYHREEAVLKMLQFAVETECLDHTVMLAVVYFDTYIRNNPMIVPDLMRVIAAVCLQISIKINEHMKFTL